MQKLLSLSLVAFMITQAACQADVSSKELVIEQAISFPLLPTSTVTTKEANEYSESAFSKVKEGHYEAAIEITLAGLQQFPHDFNLQADLAALLGDCSEITPSPLKECMITASKILFDKLIQETERQPKRVLYEFKNEYYFRHGRYREQYELGVARVADYWGTDQWSCAGIRGYYSQGVGAVHYATQLLEQGHRSAALEYAQKALVAWSQYFSYTNDYYNAYVHYALTLGIMGYEQEMMRALQKSASLIGKTLDYKEFKEVIDFVRDLPRAA